MKHLISIFTLCWCVTFSFSQGYMKYTNTTGWFTHIIPVENNNYFAIGLNNNTSHERLMAKLDQNFNAIWTKSYSNSDIFGFTAEPLALLKDGNYAVMALTNLNGGSALVIKLSPSGNILFEKNYAYPGTFITIHCISAAAGNDPGFILGGGACIKDNFLIKCDVDGEIEWAKEFNDLTITSVKAVQTILPDEDGYLCGSYVEGTNGIDAVVFRVEANGSLSWYKQLKMDNVNEVPWKLKKLSNGNLAMLITSSSTNTDDIIYFFDSSCTNVSYKRYFSSTDVSIRDIIDDGSSGIIGIGSQVIDLLSKKFYLKIDYNGGIIWKKVSRGINSNIRSNFFSICKSTTSNNFAITGEALLVGKTISVIDGNGNGLCVDSVVDLVATSPYTFNVILKNVSVANFSLIVTQQNFSTTTFNLNKSLICGVISDINDIHSSNKFRIYPNPANDILTINSEKEIGEIKIYDVIGKLIYHELIKNNNTEINVKEFNSGIYFVEINNSRVKIVKM